LAPERTSVFSGQGGIRRDKEREGTFKTDNANNANNADNADNAINALRIWQGVVEIAA
jgi:hypothetical protein